MNPQQVLILQGWYGSGPSHWQMRWVEKYGYQVLTQSDWIRPLRGDWLARLDDVVSDLKAPVYLVAHSLGCLQVASWATISKQTHKVKAALLVAPSDVEARNFEDVLSSWRPVSLEKLPFNSSMLISQDDPFCTTERAKYFAKAWGANVYNLGSRGHLNADSNLGDWSEGHAFLNDLMKVNEHGH